MSTIHTENNSHNNTVNAAETTRQASVVTTAARATVVSAEATFFRAAAKSAFANGVPSQAFMTALAETGQSLYP